MATEKELREQLEQIEAEGKEPRPEDRTLKTIDPVDEENLSDLIGVLKGTGSADWEIEEWLAQMSEKAGRGEL